jgi:Na+/phosphate symporter
MIGFVVCLIFEQCVWSHVFILDPGLLHPVDVTRYLGGHHDCMGAVIPLPHHVAFQYYFSQLLHFVMLTPSSFLCQVRPYRIGAAIGFIILAVLSTLCGFLLWRANSWREVTKSFFGGYITISVVKFWLFFGGIFYFAAAMVIVFTSPSINFLGFSITFMVANLVCILQFVFIRDNSESVTPEEYFAAEDIQQMLKMALSAFQNEFRKSG